MKRNERKQTQLLNSPLGSCPPFLIINANTIVDNRHSKSYRRKYSWGACDIENPDYTDFLLFYNLLIGYLYFPLKERTKVLREVFKMKKVKKPTARVPDLSETDTAQPKEREKRNENKGAIDFGLGVAVGVGIIGAISLFAKSWNSAK